MLSTAGRSKWRIVITAGIVGLFVAFGHPAVATDTAGDQKSDRDLKTDLHRVLEEKKDLLRDIEKLVQKLDRSIEQLKAFGHQGHKWARSALSIIYKPDGFRQAQKILSDAAHEMHQSSSPQNPNQIRLSFKVLQLASTLGDLYVDVNELHVVKKLQIYNQITGIDQRHGDTVFNHGVSPERLEEIISDTIRQYLARKQMDSPSGATSTFNRAYSFVTRILPNFHDAWLKNRTTDISAQDGGKSEASPLLDNEEISKSFQRISTSVTDLNDLANQGDPRAAKAIRELKGPDDFSTVLKILRDKTMQPAYTAVSPKKIEQVAQRFERLDSEISRWDPQSFIPYRTVGMVGESRRGSFRRPTVFMDLPTIDHDMLTNEGLSGESVFREVWNNEFDEVPVERLHYGAATKAFKLYTDLYWEIERDEGGQPRINEETGEPYLVPQMELIRATLSNAVEMYLESHDSFDPVAFKDFLVHTPDAQHALAYLQTLKRLFAQLEIVGLTPKELREAKKILIDTDGLTPRGLRWTQLDAVIECLEP